MVDDIITGLSRIKWLFVIARNSTFTYKGRPVDVKQVGRELGVRYVVEGSVRKAADRVRVSGQLIDAATGAHVWAERYDRKSDDIFALQDEIALSVVGAIEPSLRRAEVARVKRKRPENLDAYDLVLQALPDVYSVMPADVTKGARTARPSGCHRAGLRDSARLCRDVPSLPLPARWTARRESSSIDWPCASGHRPWPRRCGRADSRRVFHRHGWA